MKDGCEARGDREAVVAFVRPVVQKDGCEARGDCKAMVAFVRPIVRRMVAKQGAIAKQRWIAKRQGLQSKR